MTKNTIIPILWERRDQAQFWIQDQVNRPVEQVANQTKEWIWNRVWWRVGLMVWHWA